MSELERNLRNNPLFRNRFCASTTIDEAIAASQRYGITTSKLEVLEARARIMPELVVAECLDLALRAIDFKEKSFDSQQ